MFFLLLLHLVVGIGIVAGGGALGRRAFVVAAVAPLATVIWAATRASGVLDGEPVTESFAWVEQLGITIDLRLDAFALVMVALVSGIGLLICVYSLGYFSHDKPGLARLAGVLTLFAGAMLGVVLSDQLIALFIFWELTSVTSYLLIGNDDTNPRARAAALQAIFITGVGGLAMLAGLIIIGQAGGTYRISELLVDPPSGAVVNAGLVLVLIGAFTKSAQVPFSSWLPAAMVAPTPVSAYLHSATMVKAGVYLVARLAPMFALTGSWRALVLVVGATTMLVGGLRALRQHDLKLLLAYGTVSQLGFMMLLFGVGDYHIAEAGIILILAHGAFKAALFMVVGIVDHETGTRDIRELHGFSAAPGWRAVKVAAVISAASMAGLPPLFGFIAKEKALDGYVEHGDFAGGTAALVVIVLASILTFAYSARFVLGIFGAFGERDRDVVSVDAHAPSAVFVGPSVVLSIATVLFGIAPVLIDGLIEGATTALYPGSEPKPVELFAGFNTALLLSAVIIVCGIALTVLRAPVADLQARASDRLQAVPSTEQGFLAVLRSISVVSTRVTATVQNGSLPIYLAVIVLTVTVVPLAAFASELDDLPQFIETPAHVAPVAIMVAAGLGACIVRHRIAAALMLGAVGYAMAGLYVAQGAPDLALTQFSIETLSTVLFVLVLRFLPRSWRHRAPAIAAPMRIAVAGAVGVAVFVFALSASNARSDVDEPSMSQVMIENSLPKGKGSNVVNVILVDFRGWDTMGEITVLLVAAIGAVSLARPGRRRDEPEGPVFEEILDVGDEPKLPEALR
ncbi:MAG TPA: hydrogen gas-evolving membrane-bound hydrogenase subunit E [Ilumatobacteraceae bacterium]|nr:hydrogen gas-evolving membrane-bound hydrogenase subunit E [Ilumatobacteraceae bacterium]